jgi:hypothetical protein
MPMALRMAPGQSLQDALQAARIEAFRAAASRVAPSVRQPVAPAITAGAITAGTLTVGVANSIPTLQFTYQSKSYGLNFASFTFTSPNGGASITVQYNPRTYETSGTITFTPDTTAPYYAQPGQWVMTSAIIVDNQYNYAQYTQAQLAALFPQPFLTVVNNGPVDVKPPQVTAGQILTPTVSESSTDPTFKAMLTGTDNVSGLFLALVVIVPPGSQFGYVEIVPNPIPTRSGKIKAYSPVYSGQPTGSWAISGYELCDVAGNCLTDTNASDVQALFGTTSFTVTN